MSDKHIQKLQEENINLLNEIKGLKKTNAISLGISNKHCQEAECLKGQISSLLEKMSTQFAHLKEERNFYFIKSFVSS